jgi:cyclopropane fatty-acyl-phospholipid synthase-like methyltransferase
MKIKCGFYDKDYFEHGLESKKSCYSNYRWIPELTIPMASQIIKYLKIKDKDNILDFGCSKGYLVKSFRLLNINAYGVDVSKFAINNVDTEIKKYCKLIKNNNYAPIKKKYEWVITKDVLEHLSTEQLSRFLKTYLKFTKKMFHVIPLGDKQKFRIKEYHLDKSHIQIHDEKWWINLFKKNGWELLEFKYNVDGIKDNWIKENSKGNGFFVLKKYE